MNIPYHSDPSHGWLAVPLSLLRRLNIISDISAYSYFDAGTSTAYLEEDCDASIFVNAAHDHNITIDFDEMHDNGNHWIRDLPSYQYNHYLNWS